MDRIGFLWAQKRTTKNHFLRVCATKQIYFHYTSFFILRFEVKFCVIHAFMEQTLSLVACRAYF